MDFTFCVTSADAFHVTNVVVVHPNQQVELLVIGLLHLSGSLALASDAVLFQFPSGRGIDLVADLN